MSVATAPGSVEKVSRAAPDRRRHARVPVTMLGRFMRPNRVEYPCKMIDISVSGAAMMSPVEPEMGERIVAYFDQVGGLEGHVVRRFAGGFALEFAITQHKREKLIATLMFLLNRHELPALDTRRHERIAGQGAPKILELTEGLTVECQVIDMSISGASIATVARPAIGSHVKLGNLKAQVVRHHDLGIGLEFVDVQNPTAVRRYFG